MCTPWNERFSIHVPTTRIFEPDDDRNTLLVQSRISRAEHEAALAAVKEEFGIQD